MMTAIRKNLADFLAILGVVVLGIGIGAYILANQRLRFPLIEEPFYTVKAELPDAQAVTPGQGQTVVVAGVRIGDIGSVDLEDGKAVVTLQLEPKYKGMITDQATALLRAKTGTKDMFLEVDPGDGKPLPKDGRIPISNTLPDIDPDEFLAALDSDTRNYLKLLISGAGKGLEGRGTDLREVLKRLGPLHKDLARVSKAVAERRHNMRRLVNRYGQLMTELGKSDDDITRLVRSSNATLGAFADEDQNISSLVSKLPGTLNQTADTLGKVDTLAKQMGPTFEALRPPFRKLDDANAAVLPFVKEAAPILRDQVRPFARAAQPFQRDLGAASTDLAEATPDLTTAFRGLNRLFDIGAYNPDGTEGISEGCEKAGACTPEERARNEGYLYWLAWVGQNTVSLFSTADALGPIRRAYLLNMNCAAFTTGAREAGMGDAEADGLADLFGALGACSAP
jgi:phospholipid/cholesterol/gamma-HCH transport system substrate-binding protein